MVSVYEDPTTWRQTTPSGIRYRRKSHEGSMGFEKLAATETYLVAVADMEQFVRELFPLLIIQNGIPLYKYRSMPGTLKIKASNASWRSAMDGLPIDPFNADPNAPAGTYHPIAEVTVTYDDETDELNLTGNDPDDAKPETFLEISASSAGEFIHTPVPDSSWQTEPNNTNSTTANTSAGVPTQIIVPETEWTLRWPRITEAFFGATMIGRLRSVLGKVNSATYPLLYNAPKETLLCVGWEMTQQRQMLFESEYLVNPDIRPPVSVTVKLLEKRITVGSDTVGHNHVWRPGVGWQKLLIAANQPLYQSYNYATLFAKP